MKSSDERFDILLVDGYNIIHNWEHLAKLAESSLELARDALIHALSNYQGLKDMVIILVFDAHKIRHGHEKTSTQGNISIIYTAEFETADAYIERILQSLVKGTKKYRVAVATSDSLEQTIAMAKGAYRLSAKDLLDDLRHVESEIKQSIDKLSPIKKNQLFDNLDPATAAILDKMRYDT